ncbi:hypothetical protein D3C87_1537260 [compost metagenome]
MPHQCGKAEFRGVVSEAEHGLAEKQLAHRQAVESAHQFVPVPHFHRVRVATPVQFDVGVLHGLGDPGAVGVIPGRGTGADDGGEVLVKGHLIALLA